MAVTPQTNVKLLQVPIDLDNKNQITFSNSTDQFNYFNNLPKLEASNFSFQRKDNIIRWPGHVDNLMYYNYCMYQNENYGTKWFYAFITDMRYVNDNMTEITIATDVFQTWQFNLNYKRMFVEREHVNDDAIGLHTVPETLETGDYIIDEIIRFSDFDEMKYIIQVTEYTNGEKPLSTNFGGVYFAGRSLYM